MANPKRKAVEKFIITYIEKITKSKENVKLYQDMFTLMSDKEFDNFMKKLRDGEINLAIIVPPGKDGGVKIEDNFKIAKELGFDFFQRIKVGPDGDKMGYTTPNKYLVIRLPIRRAAQLLSKKISIPKDANHTDMLSGQVTSDSKASSLTLPELQILIGNGADKSIKELLKARGGDLGELRALNKTLYEQGGASQLELFPKQKGVVSTNTLHNLLLGAHIRSTVKKRM